MCGYVTRQTKMRSLQQVLAAIEASMPKLRGKLGKDFTQNAKGFMEPSTGVLGEKNRDGSFKNYSPGGKLKLEHWSYGGGGCNVIIPQEVFSAAGIHTNDGLGLKYDTATKTWSMMAYDGDMRRGAFDEAFNSKVFMEYNKNEALGEIANAGCTALPEEKFEYEGKPAIKVRWTKTIQVPESVAKQMYNDQV